MTAAGLAKIEEAKQDGSWDRLARVELLEIPPDLAEAFARDPEAGKRFDAFSRSSRRGVLEWLNTAKKAETRKARVKEIVRKAELGLRANFPVDRRKPG